jgi:hypothetical protein
MSNKPTSFVEWIGFKLAGKFLSLAILFGTFAVGLLLLEAAEKTEIRALYAAGALIIIIGFWAAIFPAKEVMIRMMDDRSMSFTVAVAHTMYRYLLYVAFIPVLGPLVQRIVERKKTVNPFVSDEGGEPNQSSQPPRPTGG